MKTAMKSKKRKVFDMTKARVKGTDAAKYVRSAAQLKNMEAKVKKANKKTKNKREWGNNSQFAE